MKAIKEMPAPTDVPGVQRFFRMVQYLAKFLPKLADLMKPVRELTQKNVIFAWQKAQKGSL